MHSAAAPRLVILSVRPMVARAGYVVEISADSIKDAEDTASKMRMINY